MKGRPVIPPAAREMMDNPGRRPFRATEPKPYGEPKCPKSLSPEARRVWRRVVPALRAIGLASTLDADLLAMYCVAKARWLEAQKELEKYGPVIAVRGKPAKNPWTSIAGECEQTMMRLGESRGLTALARARLFVMPAAPVPHQPVDEDVASRYFDEDDGGVVQ